MSAVVIDFAAVAALRTGRNWHMAPRRPASGPANDFTFWNGASGASYVHTVFRLLDCPELPNSNIVLVRRDREGRAEALHIGRVEEDSPSLNLAAIRRTAAQIGADEVHVHLLGRSLDERHGIERDLIGVRAPSTAGAVALH
jgi:hypothetical protein